MPKFKAIIYSLAVLAMLWDASDAGIQGSSVRALGSSYLYHKFRPSVIYADGEDSTTLEVATTGFDVAGVYIEKASNWVQMYDDGSHGDNVAGDGIYTFDNFTKYLPSDFDMRFGGDHMIWGPQVKIVKVGGAEETHWPSLGLVSPDQRIPSIEYGNGLFATEYAFFIVDSTGEIFPNMPFATIYCGQTFPVAYQKFYSIFPDIFDFIILMPNGPIFNPDNYSENVPYFVIAKNEVQNIGVPIFDDTSSFYSAGRLRGFIYHSWGYGAILDHEIGHAWGVRLGYSLGLVEGGHWVAEADVNGQMSLFVSTDGTVGHLVDNGDGTWRVEPENADTFPYPPLELYVMGLIPPEDVPPVHILVNPDYSDPQRVTAEEVITITIDQLMAAEGGERTPLYPNAQTSFNAAFIVVSDEPFSNAEIAYYSLVSMYFSSQMEGESYLTPFYTATGGLASLTAKILPAISGAVKTAGGEGIEEVTITFSNGGGVVMTDSSGNYSHSVSYGWAGTATPSKAGYTFSPSSRNYTYVTSDYQNQDYASISTGDGGDDTEGGGGCFIATAAYASQLHPHVDILRNFRDKYLMSNKLGRKLVDLYYKYSPFVANLIAKHKALKFVARLSLLPLVVFSYSTFHFGSIITAVVGGFIFVIPIFFVLFYRKKMRQVEAKHPKVLASLD